MTKREYNSQPEMLEGAKLIGAGAATIALAGAAIGIGNVFSSLIHSVFLRFEIIRVTAYLHSPSSSLQVRGRIFVIGSV
jgi:hypothetical protein